MVALEKPIREKEQISVKNPITGAEIGKIDVATREDVQAAVERARVAQPAWAAHSIHERARILMDWANLVWKDMPQAIEVIRAETGKPDGGAYEEIVTVDNVVQYYSRRAPRMLRPQTRRSAIPIFQRARVHYKPHGVVGLITPWNFPFLLAFIDMIPALIAGNTIVIKPSEITPFSARYGVDMLYRAGIPRDVVQIVNGGGETGTALVDYVDYVAFTGSTAVGRKVAVRASERLIPYSLELGGKDPFIVVRDAHLDKAAMGALLGGLENAGQACVGTERVYVEAPIYDEFLRRLLHHAERLVVGSDDGWHVHIGSLTNEREMLRCEAQIADALAKGAKVVFGGNRRPDLGPLFFEPTILTNVDHSMLVMREETFGPLIPIMKVENIDEAVRLANDNEYGLSGSIYTNNLKEGEALAVRINSGDVNINRPLWAWSTAAAPMGGQKNSGIGRRNGPEGLLRFVTPQTITIDATVAFLPQDVVHPTRLLRTYVELRRKLMPFLPFLRP
jgi:succinate-semialdehyde dehydrogenase / glutarate-semialdehyde dehydrogenase